MSFAKYAHFCSLALERSFIGKTAESGGTMLFFPAHIDSLLRILGSSFQQKGVTILTIFRNLRFPIP